MKAISTKAKFKNQVMFPGRFLSADDLDGKDYTLTIANIGIEQTPMNDGDSEQLWIVSFKEAKKKLVLKKTNCKSIEKLHGSKAEEWIGQQVTLYPTKCMAFGQQVDCIRVRETAPKAKPE